jgi:hypothetical protein
MHIAEKSPNYRIEIDVLDRGTLGTLELKDKVQVTHRDRFGEIVKVDQMTVEGFISYEGGAFGATELVAGKLVQGPIRSYFTPERKLELLTQPGDSPQSVGLLASALQSSFGRNLEEAFQAVSGVLVETDLALSVAWYTKADISEEHPLKVDPVMVALFTFVEDSQKMDPFSLLPGDAFRQRLNMAWLDFFSTGDKTRVEEILKEAKKNKAYCLDCSPLL